MGICVLHSDKDSARNQTPPLTQHMHFQKKPKSSDIACTFMADTALL